MGTIPWTVAMGMLGAGIIGLIVTPYSSSWETDPDHGEHLHSGSSES